jgi:putative peptidoglycan lipid II flippase
VHVDDRLRQSTIKLAAAGLVLAAALWLCEAPVAHLFAGWRKLSDVASLALLAAIGGVVYGAIVLALIGPHWVAAFRARQQG